MGDELRTGPEQLVLHGGERLSADVARGLNWPAFVTLSALGAGSAPLRSGDDDRAHLSDSILAGGARALVVSSIRPGQQEELSLFTHMYENLLRRGLPPAEALRRAREELRSASDGAPPPIAAQLVHAIGLAHDAPFKRPHRWRPLIMSALGGVLCVAIWSTLRRRERTSPAPAAD